MGQVRRSAPVNIRCIGWLAGQGEGAVLRISMGVRTFIKSGKKPSHGLEGGQASRTPASLARDTALGVPLHRALNDVSTRLCLTSDFQLAVGFASLPCLGLSCR